MKKVISIVVGLLLASVSMAQIQTFMLDTVTHQKITGFGAFQAFIADAIMTMHEPNRTKTLDMLFSPDQAGISILGNELEPLWGDYSSYGDTTDASQYWVMQQAKTRGVSKFYSVPSSPPGQWKANDTTTGGPNGDDPNNYLLAENYGVYAKYLANYLKMYQSRGIEMECMSIQNEPDWNADYRSCIWTKEQMTNFAILLKDTLEANNINTPIMMPECATWMNAKNYSAYAMSNLDARNAIGILAGHDFGGGNIAEVFAIADQYKKEIWEATSADLEGTDESIKDGLKCASHITKDLSEGNVSAWFYWWLINISHDPSGTSLLRYNRQQDIIYVAKRFYTFSQFSRFIRPGYRRIGISNSPVSTDSLQMVAFTDSSRTKVVLVITNRYPGSKTTGIDFSNYDFSNTVQVYRTTSTDSVKTLADETISDKTFEAIVPAESVTTYIFAASPLSVGKEQTGSVHIYPNPAQDVLNVNMVATKNKNSVLTIYNVLGECLATINTEGADQKQIDISHFNKGIYFLSVNTGDEKYIQKVIID